MRWYGRSWAVRSAGSSASGISSCRSSTRRSWRNSVGTGRSRSSARSTSSGMLPSLDPSLGVSGLEQIGDPVSVAGQPVGRDRRVASSVNRHQRLPGLPGPDHRTRVGADPGPRPAAKTVPETPVLVHVPLPFEGNVEAAVFDLDTGGQGGDEAEVVVAGALDRRLPAFELAVEGDRRGADELLAEARGEAQLFLQAIGQALLGRFVADRHRPLEMHEPSTVDPGHRRRTVDQRRQHAQSLAVPGDVELDPRRIVGRLGQPGRLDDDADPPPQRGQDRGHQLTDLARRHVAARGQLLGLPGVEADLAHRA